MFDFLVIIHIKTRFFIPY